MRPEVGGLAVQDEAAGLDQGQRPQVLDQPLHEPGLVEDRLEMGGIGRVDAVEQGLEVALDHGERRAQLVGDVGQGGSALLFDLFQAGTHGVEERGQVAHLAWAASRGRAC